VEQTLRIGFALDNLRLPFRATLGHCARERAAQLGADLLAISTVGGADQSAAIEELIRRRVDALIVLPSELPAILPPLRQAARAGLPVIAVDIEIPGADAVCTVRSDNVRGGELAAEYLLARLAGRGCVANLQGPRGVQSAIHRSEGLHSILDAHPGMEIAFEASSEWTRESGHRLMRAALEARPDISAVFAANDMIALGALDAIARCGRGGEISVVGFDADADALLSIRSGAMSATVRQLARDMGHGAVDLALRAVRAEPLPPLVLTAVELLTSDHMLDASLDTLQILPGLLQDLVERSETQRRLQQEVIAAQQRTIQELSTPLIPINDDILVLPLIGTIDTPRAQQIMATMLETIARKRAQTIIVDITGVPLVDTNVAHHLLQAARAAQLLGATTILVGITPEVAQTVVQLGVDLSGLVTRGNLQTGLEYALALGKGPGGRKGR
jgi:ribose transport system substrate-binding protein